MIKKLKKKVLVVGGTGFLGSNLCFFLSKKNFEVISISRKFISPKVKLKRVKYLRCDITDKQKLNRILNKEKNISVVVNLGGDINHNNKKNNYRSHYLGLKNLAEFYLNLNIEKFIQIGSSMEYGKIRSPHLEKNKCKPLSSYGKAKYLATKYLEKIHLKKNFPAVIVRLYQVYGAGQLSNRFIPFVISNCLKDKKFPCSHGKQSRDFLYVSDFEKAIFKIIKSKNKINGQIFNLGYGKPIKLRKIIYFIRNKINLGFPDFGKVKMRNEEKLKTYPNINKIFKYTKWKPAVRFPVGIKKTIKFYKNQSV